MAVDLDDLGYVGEGDPGRGGGEFDAAVDTSAVVTGDDTHGGDLCPGQLLEGLVKTGLVPFHGQQVVGAAFSQSRGGGVLGVEGVSGDQYVGEVLACQQGP